MAPPSEMQSTSMCPLTAVKPPMLLSDIHSLNRADGFEILRLRRSLCRTVIVATRDLWATPPEIRSRQLRELLRTEVTQSFVASQASSRQRRRLSDLTLLWGSSKSERSPSGDVSSQPSRSAWNQLGRWTQLSRRRLFWRTVPQGSTWTSEALCDGGTKASKHKSVKQRSAYIRALSSPFNSPSRQWFVLSFQLLMVAFPQDLVSIDGGRACNATFHGGHRQLLGASLDRGTAICPTMFFNVLCKYCKSPRH
jgi:hypothetical protein